MYLAVGGTELTKAPHTIFKLGSFLFQLEATETYSSVLRLVHVDRGPQTGFTATESDTAAKFTTDPVPRPFTLAF